MLGRETWYAKHNGSSNKLLWFLYFHDNWKEILDVLKYIIMLSFRYDKILWVHLNHYFFHCVKTQSLKSLEQWITNLLIVLQLLQKLQSKLSLYGKVLWNNFEANLNLYPQSLIFKYSWFAVDSTTRNISIGQCYCNCQNSYINHND